MTTNEEPYDLQGPAENGELIHPTYKGWDEGHCKGLIKREHKRLKKGQNDLPPEYYAESNPLIRYAKAIGLAFSSIVLYTTVLDTLGELKPLSFVPCNNQTCHYMRLFNSRFIPATGVDVMAVKNGVERPIAMHYFKMQPYSCPLKDKNRTWEAKAWGPASKACHPMTEKQVTSFMQEHDTTRKSVKSELEKAQSFTWTLRMAFYFTKVPLCIFAWPMNLISKYNPKWGMEHVPSARCEHLNEEQMQAKCADPKTQSKLYNHLQRYSPAKLATIGGLLGYALLLAVHDCMLLTGRFTEMTTLKVGFASVTCLGIASAAIFFWAMGAAEVFAAPVEFNEDGTASCACYYRIPEITALVGLSTPFALFASFAGKVQMQGMAMLFGDYLSYQTYTLPHYMAKQSFLWTWAVLCSPKLAGTTVGKPRQQFETEQWSTLQTMQKNLFWLMMFVQAVLALSASAFMIAFKELLISLYLRGDMTELIQHVIKYVILPLPSVVTVGIGCYAAWEIYVVTITEGCESYEPDDPSTGFGSQLDTLVPFTVRIPSRTLDRTLAVIFLIVGWLLLLIWTISTAQGLAPDLNFLLGKEELEYPKLAQAELWGGCGFIFFFVHIPRVMAIAFSTWEDMASLTDLGKADTGVPVPGTPAWKLKNAESVSISKTVTAPNTKAGYQQLAC